jgi:hypothetical protein
MSTTFDIADVSKQFDHLRAHPHIRKFAVVLPLAAGMRDVAREFLSEGPPYDFEAAGIDSHEVVLSDEEAVFIFGTPEGPAALERILADEDFWAVVSSWEHIAAGPPRAAEIAFDWSAA